MLAFLLFVLLSTNVIALIEELCPPTDLIPCRCYYFNGVPVVECHSSSLSEQDMGIVFATLQNYKLGTLRFRNINFEMANEDMYKGLYVEKMELKDVSVEKFSSRPGAMLLTGLENTLSELSVLESFHSGAALDHMALSHMNRLEWVSFHGNAISYLGNEWFAEGPKGLDTLMFTESGIQRLGDQVFQALEGLHSLILIGNDIREIRRSMLPSPGPNLEEISLSSNKLTNLPNDLFTNLPALRFIYLLNNQIKTLPQGIFPNDPTSSILVNLQENPLICDDDLKWICSTSHTFNGNCEGYVMSGTRIHDFCAQQLRT